MIEVVLYTQHAKEDIKEAYEWYEQREPTLGDEFLRCLESCVSSMQRNAEMYPIAVDGYRRALVRRFPFEVFYGVTDGVLMVYSVFHCSQHPGKWRRRLRED